MSRDGFDFGHRGVRRTARIRERGLAIGASLGLVASILLQGVVVIGALANPTPAAAASGNAMGASPAPGTPSGSGGASYALPGDGASLRNVPPQPAPPKVPTEKAGLRTANSDTLQNPDGTYTASYHVNRINYRDATGAWQPIDLSLVPTTGTSCPPPSPGPSASPAPTAASGSAESPSPATLSPAPPSASPSPSLGASLGPQVAASASPSPTASASDTPSPSLNPTPSPSAVPTSSPSPSASPLPSPTPVPSASPSPTSSASPSPSPSPLCSPSYDLMTKANDVRFSASSTDPSTALALATYESYSLSVRVPGVTSAAVTLAGHALAFPNGPNADVTLDPLANGYEFGAVLADPSSPNSYAFAFNAPGLTASLASDGQTIVFADPTVCAPTPPPAPTASPAPAPSGSPGPSASPSAAPSAAPSASPSASPAPSAPPLCLPTEIAEIAAPALSEANGAGSDPHSVSVALDVAPVGLNPGEVLATYTIDPAYLSAVGRTYPVTLDPSTIYNYCEQTGLSGTCIQHSGATGTDVIVSSGNSSPATFTVLRVGASAEAGFLWGTNRELLYFPQVVLGDGAQVVSANVDLYETANYGSGQSIVAYANSGTWGPSTTWSTKPTPVSGISSLPTLVNAGGAWVDINATTIVNDQYVLSPTAQTQNAIANWGFTLQLTNEAQSEVQFDNNAGPTGKAPELVISYTIPQATISFDPALGPNWAPSTLPASGTLTLPVVVTNKSGFTMGHDTASSDFYQIAAIPYYAATPQFGSFPNPSFLANLPADLLDGQSSAPISLQITTPGAYGDTIRLDLVHSYTDANGVQTKNYSANWAWQSLYFARDKNTLDPGNVHWTGNSVIERDEFSVSQRGTGPDQGPTKSVGLPDGSTASIHLDSGALNVQAASGIGFQDLGASVGVSYQYDSGTGYTDNCTAVLGACGWSTNLDEHLTESLLGDKSQYVDAKGNAYPLSANAQGQIQSGAQVQIDHNRATLFDDSELSGWSTSQGISPTWTTSQAFNSISSYSEPSANWGFDDLTPGAGSLLPLIDINQFPLVSFAVRGVTTSGAAVGFEVKDATTNVTNWLFYTVGTDFTIGNSKIALGGLITAWNNTSNRYLYSDILAQGWAKVAATDDLQLVGFETRGNGTAGGTAYFDAVHFDPRGSGAINDSTPTWTSGGAAATVAAASGEIYAGTQSIKVTPTAPTAGPTAAATAVYNYLPYITWAWKKVGGNSLGIEFTATDTTKSPNVTKTILYYAGTDEGFDTSNVIPVQVSASAPTNWTVVTRDLLADARQALGFYTDYTTGNLLAQAAQAPSPDNVAGVSYSLVVPDGQYGLFDNLNFSNTPHGSQAGDDYIVTEPGGAVHNFNRDGILTSIRDLDGNTTHVNWTYLPLVSPMTNVSNANYQLTSIGAPSDGQATSGAAAVRQILVTYPSNAVRFTEKLGTTTSSTGRYMEFDRTGTNLISVIPASRSASCSGSAPTGCIGYAYTAGILNYVFDPRSDGTSTTPNHDVTALVLTGGKTTEVDDLSGSSAAALLHIDSFSSGNSWPNTVQWEDAAGLAAPTGNVYTRFEDLDPNGDVLNEYAPCISTICTAAAPGALLAKYQTDGLARITSQVQYRGAGGTLGEVSRRSTLASVAIDNYSDPISGADTIWTQSPEQYQASLALCSIALCGTPTLNPLVGPDAYRTFMGYDQFGQPASVATPHLDAQPGLYTGSIAGAGALGYWRLNDTTSTMADSSGNGYSGTYSAGGITHSQPGALVGDPTNAAAAFASASSGYASVSSLPATSGSFTVEAWINTSSSANQGIVGSRASADDSYDLQLYNGKLHSDIGTGSAWLTTSADVAFAWTPLVWYHVAEVVTPTSWTLYLNGAAVGSGGYASATPVLSNATHTFALGNIKTGSGSFNGSLDEVAVYNKALSAGQIAMQFAAGRDAVIDTSNTAYSTVDGGSLAVHFIATGHPLSSSDQFIANPGFESGLDAWVTGGTWYTTSPHTGHGALQLTGAQSATQDAELIPGQTFRFAFAGSHSAGFGLTYDVIYQQTSGSWAEIPGLGAHTLIPSAWPAAGATSAAWNATVPYDGTGRVRVSFSVAGGSGTVFVDDVALFTSVEGHTYATNGTLATSTDANGVVTVTNDAPSSTNPGIFPTSVVGNSGGAGGGNVANSTMTYTNDAWGRVLTARDPDLVTTTTTYVSSGNGFDTAIASSADGLGNTTSYTYDAAGNVLTVTPPNGATETTSKAYTFQNAVATITPPSDASGHASVTVNSYNAQGQLTQSAADSGGLNVLTTYTYDEFGRQAGSVADSGGLGATTNQSYDLLGNPVAHTVYQGPGTTNGETTTTYYDAAGTANASQAPIAPAPGSSAPNCTTGAHSGGSPYCDSFSVIAFDGSAISSVDAYAKIGVANTDFAGHPIRTIANFVTGTYSSAHPDQDITKTATFDVLGRPVSSTDTLGLTASSTYDALGRVTLRETCDATCTTYTWSRTDYTPAGRVWKSSAQGDQTTFATGDTAVAWTESVYDAAGRAAATLANYDVTGSGNTWAGQANAGTFLDGFETGLSSDWSNATDGLLGAGASSSLDLTTARTGLASQSVLTSASTIHTGAKWALSSDRYGSFVFQSGHYYHLHALVMSPTSGKTLQGFLGTTASSCSTSTVTTTGAWQAIDCTWHPASSATSGVEAVVRQGDAATSSITFLIDDVAVFESDSTGAPLTATPTNVANSVSAYDADSHVVASTLAPGHLAKDGTIGETGIPVTATTYDRLGRVLSVSVDATAAATGSYPSLIRATPALVTDVRLNEPTSLTTAADLVSAASLTATSVTFGGTSPLANASRGPAGSAGSGSFNGTSSVISRSSAAMSNVDNYTLAAWFKFATTPTAEQGIVENGTVAGGYGLMLTSSGHLAARYGSSSVIDSTVTPSANTWHFAVLVRNAGTSTLYLDGSAVGPTPTTAPSTPSAAFSIGREDSTNGRYFTGSIAEVAALNAPLSAGTIGALYTAGNPSGTANADQNLTTAYAYDGLGRRTDVMDPAGIVTHAVYDHLGRTTSGVANYAPGDPTQSGAGVDVTLNATSLAAYDSLGEVTATCSPDGVVAGCTAGNIGTSSLAWHYAYSLSDHQYAAIPPVNITLTALDPTEVVYDAADLRTATTYSCPSGATMTYGTACTSYTRRVNATTYDGIGHLTETVVANSSNTTQITNDTTFDGVGHALTQTFNGTPISEGTASAAFTFDTLERPSTTSINSVSQTSVTYAPGGQIATRTDSLVSATASSFTYDPLGRLVTAYSPLFGATSNKVGFSWRTDGLLDGRTQYSGLAFLAYAYDGAKRPLTECSSSTCSGATVDVERTYDRTSNVASETQTLTGANTNQNGTQSFTYDPLDRVTGSTLGAITKSYAYDASGNRLTAIDGGVTSTFTYDRADEIIKNNYASTDHNFAYDAYGNLTAESVSNGGSATTTSYVYDLADRMTKITQADASILGFTFDALGRHTSRTSGSTPTTIDTYGYVGSSDVVVQDVENVAGITINAALDSSADRLMTGSGGSVAWLIPDLHGDVIGQTATSGTLTDCFRFDAFGLAEGTALTGSIPTPWRYQGRLLESTSGGRDLYDFAARSYAPDLGAFTQLDSVAGSAQNPASLDRYLYATANPETLIDPTGHAVPWNGCGPDGIRCNNGGQSNGTGSPQPTTTVCTSLDCAIEGWHSSGGTLPQPWKPVGPAGCGATGDCAIPPAPPGAGGRSGGSGPTVGPGFDHTFGPIPVTTTPAGSVTAVIRIRLGAALASDGEVYVIPNGTQTVVDVGDVELGFGRGGVTSLQIGGISVDSENGLSLGADLSFVPGVHDQVFVSVPQITSSGYSQTLEDDRVVSLPGSNGKAVRAIEYVTTTVTTTVNPVIVGSATAVVVGFAAAAQLLFDAGKQLAPAW
jgi:RHS repeat-associated protein